MSKGLTEYNCVKIIPGYDFFHCLRIDFKVDNFMIKMIKYDQHLIFLGMCVDIATFLNILNILKHFCRAVQVGGAGGPNNPFFLNFPMFSLAFCGCGCRLYELANTAVYNHAFDKFTEEDTWWRTLIF